MREDHVAKRNSPLGRWLPPVFYAFSLLGWLLAGISAWLWHLLWLVVLPLLPLILYVVFTIRRGNGLASTRRGS